MGIASDYLREEYDLYQKIYDLENYYCIFENVPKQFFEHLQMRNYFIVVAPFTLDRKHYVIPYVTCRLAFSGSIAEDIEGPDYQELLLSCNPVDLANGNYVCSGDSGEAAGFSANVNDQCIYRFPSGAVDRSIDTSILDTARRVIDRNLQADMAGDLLPLASFTNRFICENGNIHYHKGIGFSCKLRMTGEKFRDINSKRGRRLSGIFINTSEEDLQHFSHNWDFLLMRKVVAQCHEGPMDEHEGEINSSLSLSARYLAHDWLVKPLFRMIKSSKTLIDKVIFDEIEKVKQISDYTTYLDVSAGDDSAPLRIAEKNYPNGCVIANDVSWKSLERLRKKNRQRTDNVYFTNHGASDRSYRSNSIDISVCKNTLHHTRDHDELKSLIANLLEITKHTAIVVDIDNPCSERGIPCLVNSYYRLFLHDQGDNFLSEKQFRTVFESGEIGELVREKGFSVEFYIFKAVFGNSMVAVLRKRIDL